MPAHEVRGTEAEYGVFVFMYVTTSEYESSFSSLILDANLSKVFDADGSAFSSTREDYWTEVVVSSSFILCS